MLKLSFCNLETEDNFVFCVHPLNGKDKIALVFTNDKEAEGDQKTIYVDFCPFCGFSEKKDI